MKNIIKKFVNSERRNKRIAFKRMDELLRFSKQLYLNDNFKGEIFYLDGLVLQLQRKDKDTQITEVELNDLIQQIKDLGINPNGIMIKDNFISIDWGSANYSIILTNRESKRLASEFKKYIKSLKLENFQILICSLQLRPCIKNDRLIAMQPHFNEEYFGDKDILVTDSRDNRSKIYFIS